MALSCIWSIPFALQIARRSNGKPQGRRVQVWIVESFLCISHLRLQCQHLSICEILHVKCHLPLKMPALGQRQQALVVHFWSRGPHLPHRCTLSLLHSTCWHVGWKEPRSEKVVLPSNKVQDSCIKSWWNQQPDVCQAAIALDKTVRRTSAPFACRWLGPLISLTVTMATIHNQCLGAG